MAMFFLGVVTCSERGERAVRITFDQRDDLAAGRMPCPCCGQPCAPSVRFLVAQGAAPASVSWYGTRWDAAALHES